MLAESNGVTYMLLGSESRMAMPRGMLYFEMQAVREKVQRLMKRTFSRKL